MSTCATWRRSPPGPSWKPGHAGRAYTPTGPVALTYDDCAAILSDVLGRPIRYADPTPWHYWRRMHRRRMPAAMVVVTLGIYTAARFGLGAGLTDDVERVTGRPAIDFATFARDCRDAWARPRRRRDTERPMTIDR